MSHTSKRELKRTSRDQTKRNRVTWHVLLSMFYFTVILLDHICHMELSLSMTAVSTWSPSRGGDSSTNSSMSFNFHPVFCVLYLRRGNWLGPWFSLFSSLIEMHVWLLQRDFPFEIYLSKKKFFFFFFFSFQTSGSEKWICSLQVQYYTCNLTLIWPLQVFIFIT